MQAKCKSWLFLALSDLATGLSWLFYCKALQLGDASKVAPSDKLRVAITMALAFVILGEPIRRRSDIWNWL